MAVNLSPVGGVAAQFFDNSGNVLTGGLLYSYLAGTTTPAITYTSANGFTANSNPIVLNAAGRVPDSGEIWLTDGINYKFVLKDSNDVQIATWDNIDGINSNFLNYTLQDQSFIATQGQTAFTLTTMQYVPGTNNLAVFVNGSKQQAGVNYLETSATVFTFVDGLNVDDIVEAITAIPVATSVTNAANVSYNEGSTGAVNTNVEKKLQEYVSVKDFGAVGDGVADDTAALQLAFDNLDTLDGGNLYFPTGTYKITEAIRLGTGTSTITASNINIIGGPDVIIYNTFGGGGGYPGDGFIIGNPTSTDGGTGTDINISNVYISGFQFNNTRIGVWVVYARNVTVENIYSGGIAVVAAGNDANDNCENITFRNIYRTAAQPSGSFYTVGIYSTLYFTLDNIQSAYTSGSEHITIKTSSNGSISNVHCQGVGTGIAIIDGSCFISVSNFSMLNCTNGIITFGESNIYGSTFGIYDKACVFSNGVISYSSNAALQPQASGSLFENIITYGSGVASVILYADGTNNTFSNCSFREQTLIDSANVKQYQTWTANYGISSVASFSAVSSTTTTNTTGDGTAYTVVLGTVEYDSLSSYNSSTGAFTAPYTGQYLFNASVGFPAGTGWTYGYINISTTTYSGNEKTFAVTSGTGLQQLYGSIMIHMTAGQPAYLKTTFSGGTKNVSVGPYISPMYFTGQFMGQV